MGCSFAVQLQRPQMGFLLLASGKTELLRFSLSAGATYCCSNGCAPVASWCRPQVVHVKCNADTAFSEDGQ
ncbi:hypothetical protein ES332_A06G161400v1 [Gossypium tomentosum]|uniref:Uncharacterized protein n=1 Tax=Gossypium tomentosum TaxID=34277 RepID=A0A5D2Q723_GOSTO|nr:hypothetical protein ES332_A06G161400v1 [Gossypium tomentosum]TYI23385.1 hypothetical protein ES332_A06G161400v1 [Gossypium tomentosum]